MPEWVGRKQNSLLPRLLAHVEVVEFLHQTQWAGDVDASRPVARSSFQENRAWTPYLMVKILSTTHLQY